VPSPIGLAQSPDTPWSGRPWVSIAQLASCWPCLCRTILVVLRADLDGKYNRHIEETNSNSTSINPHLAPHHAASGLLEAIGRLQQCYVVKSIKLNTREDRAPRSDYVCVLLRNPAAPEFRRGSAGVEQPRQGSWHRAAIVAL
jgi:hypothetical protein